MSSSPSTSPTSTPPSRSTRSSSTPRRPSAAPATPTSRSSRPPLKLVLIENPDAAGTLNHLGVEVATTDEVTAATGRLRGEGLDTATEDNVTCCYAVQDKVWVSDPDAGRLGDLHRPGRRRPALAPPSADEAGTRRLLRQPGPAARRRPRHGRLLLAPTTDREERSMSEPPARRGDRSRAGRPGRRRPPARRRGRAARPRGRARRPAAHVAQWGHVRLFSPWSFNVDPASDGAAPPPRLGRAARPTSTRPAGNSWSGIWRRWPPRRRSPPAADLHPGDGA